MTYFEIWFTLIKCLLTHAPRFRDWGHEELLVLLNENFYKNEVRGRPAIQVPISNLGTWYKSRWLKYWRDLVHRLEEDDNGYYVRVGYNEHHVCLVIRVDELKVIQDHPSNLMPLQWAIWDATEALKVLNDIFTFWKDDEIAERKVLSKRKNMRTPEAQLK